MELRHHFSIKHFVEGGWVGGGGYLSGGLMGRWLDYKRRWHLYESSILISCCCLYLSNALFLTCKRSPTLKSVIAFETLRPLPPLILDCPIYAFALLFNAILIP